MDLLRTRMILIDSVIPIQTLQCTCNQEIDGTNCRAAAALAAKVAASDPLTLGIPSCESNAVIDCFCTAPCSNASKCEKGWRVEKHGMGGEKATWFYFPSLLFGLSCGNESKASH